MEMKMGPSGLGSVKTVEKVLDEYKKLGIKICEIGFTYSVYIKKEEAGKIKKLAKDRDIELSIHAPYFVNLNSEDPKKLEATKQRILKCCERGHDLGVKNIVFHPGYYGKNYGSPKTSEKTKKEIRKETYENIRNQIKELLEEVKKNKWDVNLCPETMGKINVFGSIEEISNLAKDTGCSFCIDFAHILARNKKVDYEKIKKSFPQKNWHCHFSGIVYGEKGEKHHKKTEKKDWKDLFKNLPEGKNISIVGESPDTVKDVVEGMKIWKNGRK